MTGVAADVHDRFKTAEDVPPTRSGRWRLFAGARDEPRSRRASDILLLLSALLGVLFTGAIAAPPAGIERAVLSFVDNVPNALDGLWQFTIDLLGVVAVGVFVLSISRHRWAIARDVVVAAAAGIGASELFAHSVVSAWPPILQSLQGDDPSTYVAPLRLLLPAVAVMTASPHLSQPARRVNRVLVVAAFFATVFLDAATPIGATATVLLGAAVAASVHLAFGSPRGRPSLDDVAGALEGVGVVAHQLGAANRQRAGVFVVEATANDGGRLLVKIYGRDAHDTQLVSTAWRTVWYREPGAPAWPGRRQQAEHEAFLTLLARQAGVVTDEVVTAGATTRDDVVLVLRPVGNSIRKLEQPWTADELSAVWRMLRLLHATGIAHGQVDDQCLVYADGAAGLVDFRGGHIAPTDDRLHVDQAQLFVTTVLASGAHDATHAAVDALGAEGLAATLPFVQQPALTPHQRTQLRQAKLDLDDVRNRAAELAGVDAPELEKLRRVTFRTAVQPVLLVAAFYALATQLGDLKLGDMWTQAREASLWFVLFGFVLAQTTRIAQSMSTMGASPAPLPLGPVYALQLAGSYIALAIPTYAARIALQIRFFQRYGLPAGAVLAIGALDTLSHFVLQMVLLGGLLLLTSNSIQLDLDSAVPSGLVRLVILVGIGCIIAIVVVFVVPKLRRAVVRLITTLIRDAVNAARGITSLRRLGMLFGGNLANELLFAGALWAFVRSLGYPVGLWELVFINITVGLLSGLIPVPGGIGVVEGGMAFGLVRAGLPEETAFAAVLMYRLATFYVPPTWGFFALRWLEKRKYL